MTSPAFVIGTVIAAGATAAAAIPPPPPVIVDGDARSRQVMLAWLPGEVRCDGNVTRPMMLRRPLTAIGWSNRDPEPIIYRFAIDQAGRPLSIERTSTPFVPMSDDVGPSLAVSRFRSGAPHQACTLSYTARRTAIADAPVTDLYSYTVTPVGPRLPREGWERISPPGASCVNGQRPEPLLRAFPDFKRVAATPGVRDWAMIGYDLDQRGRPMGVHVLGSTGNASLDRESIAATDRSRFAEGPRTGCLYPYWRAPLVLAAPARLGLDDATPDERQCPAGRNWSREPTLSYPDNYRRRSIEGWAIIAFDVAPWGATGNVRVLDSQPAAEFGERAAIMIRGATKIASPEGATGCVQVVRFAMAPRAGPGTVPEQEQPPPF